MGRDHDDARGGVGTLQPADGVDGRGLLDRRRAGIKDGGSGRGGEAVEGISAQDQDVRTHTRLFADQGVAGALTRACGRLFQGVGLTQDDDLGTRRPRRAHQGTEARPLRRGDQDDVGLGHGGGVGPDRDSALDALARGGQDRQPLPLRDRDAADRQDGMAAWGGLGQGRGLEKAGHAGGGRQAVAFEDRGDIGGSDDLVRGRAAPAAQGGGGEEILVGADPGRLDRPGLLRLTRRGEGGDEACDEECTEVQHETFPEGLWPGLIGGPRTVKRRCEPRRARNR